VDSVERVLWWLFGSSMGAPTRARVLLAIREQPRNAQQLSGALGLDYTTVRHHLRILSKNGLVTTAGERYGQVYFVSTAMESHWSIFERIVDNVRGKGGRHGRN
jgi:DNA-binding transcriptional ArsR family regulator